MRKFYTGPSVCSDVMQHLGKGSFIYLISYFFYYLYYRRRKGYFLFQKLLFLDNGTFLFSHICRRKAGLHLSF